MAIKLPKFSRVVIKVGSSLIAPDKSGPSIKYLLPLAQLIAKLKQDGKEVVIVSSGSVACGYEFIKSNDVRPSLAEKQAMAAVGQTSMMANWARVIDTHCAQVLLTHDDIRNRSRFVNIKNTIRELLNNNILPIVNENDTVAVDELKVGDNDNLAALVSLVVEADLLIICSDVDGLYTSDPRKNKNAKMISKVTKIDKSIFDLAKGTTNKRATGGMTTKIQAANKACSQGINTVIINGRKPESFQSLADGKINGTLFTRNILPERAKKRWLRQTLVSKGSVIIDAGAKKALQKDGASLLSVGIKEIAGEFHSGEAVQIIYKNKVIATGIIQFDNDELVKIIGKKSSEVEKIIPGRYSNLVIHRDDMVLVEGK